MAKTSYKDSGVDLDVYAESMARLPRLLKRTHSPRVLPAEGGFAGLFQLDFSDGLFARKYQDPVLVSGTDGVGTKIMVATRRYTGNEIPSISSSSVTTRYSPAGSVRPKPFNKNGLLKTMVLLSERAII